MIKGALSVMRLEKYKQPADGKSVIRQDNSIVAR